MTTFRPILALAGGDLTMPRIIFWILLIIWAIGGFYSDNPNVVRGTRALMIVLFAILGYYTFGF